MIWPKQPIPSRRMDVNLCFSLNTLISPVVHGRFVEWGSLISGKKCELNIPLISGHWLAAIPVSDLQLTKKPMSPITFSGWMMIGSHVKEWWNSLTMAQRTRKNNFINSWGGFKYFDIACVMKISQVILLFICDEDLYKTRKVINLTGAFGNLKVDTRQYWRVPEYHYVTWKLGWSTIYLVILK